MKKIALAFAAISMMFAGSASAADMAVKARPAPIPAPVFSWTGFYLGVHGGGGWFDKDWDVPLTALNIANGCVGCPRPAGGHTGSSWLAGGQVGFNYQTGMWVLGVEADASWTDLRGSEHLAGPRSHFLQQFEDRGARDDCWTRRYRGQSSAVLCQRRRCLG